MNRASLRTDCRRKGSLHLSKGLLVPQVSARGPNLRHLGHDHTYASYSVNEILY